MGRRKALLIATGHYEDPRWNKLEAPLRDAEELARVLQDPAIGRYEVTQVLDQQAHLVLRALQRFFTAAQRDDELLLYFSCHGIKDYDEALYFTGTDTLREPELLDSYGVPAEFVSRHLQRCAAERKVLLLDCCFSGAFRLGAKGGGWDIDLGGSFDGSGTVVISATDETQLAFELIGDDASTRPSLSVFTGTLIDGLRTGAADVDGDGLVSAEDLYKYVCAEMRAQRSRQTPKLWILDGMGSLAIAERVRAEGPAVSGVAEPGEAGIRRAPVRSEAARILDGVSPMAELLRRTVGPRPRPAVVNLPDGSVERLTDTTAIVRAVVPLPGRAGIGGRLVRELVDRVTVRTGDGSATAVLVLESLLRTLQPAIDSGLSPLLVSRAVPDSFRRAEELLGIGDDIRTKEDIARVVGTVTGRPRHGELIAEAMDKVGKEGVLTVEESHSFGMELELVEGTAFHGGCLSPRFLLDEGSGEVVLENPYVLCHPESISSVGDLLPVIEQVMQSGRPLLIIAGDVEGEALSTLVVNKARDVFTSVAVKAPGFGARRKAMLADIAILTGGEVITEEIGLSLPRTTLSLLGSARRVIVTEHETAIVDGAGGSDQVARRVRQIRAEIENSRSDYDREQLQERLAKLAGGVAVLRAGAGTQAEREEMTATLRDAVRLAKAAVADGIVPGAASALAVLGARLANDQARDIRAVSEATLALTTALIEALRQPLLAVADNSGEPDGEAVVVRTWAEWPLLTYDATTSAFPRSDQAGIWDPITVPRTVLREVAGSVQEFLSVL